MNYYYIKLPSGQETYTSEIAFINTPETFIAKEVWWITFAKGPKKNGYYLDYNGYLRKLYWEARQNKNEKNFILKSTNGLISDCQHSIRYYSYIKVIKDVQNPQYEGQIMIFTFGQFINNKIKDYVLSNNVKSIDNVFKLTVVNTQGFPNYDRSIFTDKEISLFDQNLNINNDIKFRPFLTPQLERKEKLKIINSINE